MIRGVPKHLAKLSIGIDDIAEFKEGSADKDETRFVNICNELVFIVILIELIIHTVNLLHLENILLVKVSAV